MNHHRRRILKSLPALPALLTSCHSDQADPAVANDLDGALRYKFRGIRGGEKRIDAFKEEAGVALYLESGLLFAAGVFNKGAKTSGYGGGSAGDQLVVPKTLRLVRYSEDSRRRGGIREPAYDGTPILDVTVPVAERIPDEVLDRIRKYKGSLILKFRIHPKTLMVAWEVRNGRSYPFKRDEWGNAYTTDEDDMVGGDFCERRVQNRIIDGRSVLVESKGWYIDPETGQRIEADF
ncbi:hypothetical protein AAG895_08110 [Thauera sp. JM12B12]|uniref:hypothetical protein n=1 Tax=Thauera sp. JM12B12 TaxID=3142262 RepID=UPI0031F3D6A1